MSGCLDLTAVADAQKLIAARQQELYTTLCEQTCSYLSFLYQHEEGRWVERQENHRISSSWGFGFDINTQVFKYGTIWYQVGNALPLSSYALHELGRQDFVAFAALCARIRKYTRTILEQVRVAQALQLTKLTELEAEEVLDVK